MPSSDPERFARRAWKSWTEPELATVEGVETAFRRGGSGPSLLYLHGGGATRQWGPIHRALAERFDVIAPEHPGFGDSARHPDQDSFQDFVLHYDAFLRELGLTEPVHLAGTSLGAWIAADLAIHYPERFASLSLVTPLGVRIEDDPVYDVFRLGERAPAALFNGRQDLYLPEMEQEGEIEDLLRGVEEDAVAALLFFNPRYDHKLDRRLERVRIAALVIAAQDDRMVGNRQAPRYAELLPNATLVTIAGPGGKPSSHGMVVEQPQDVADAIHEHAVHATA